MVGDLDITISHKKRFNFICFAASAGKLLTISASRHVAVRARAAKSGPTS
jgi:hypothetical protein